MIVYNLSALLVGIFSAALFGLIYWIAPSGTFTTGNGIIAFTIIVLLLSAFVEKEMKPRVFWLPLTLWAYGLLALGIKEEYGEPNFTIFIAVSVVLAAFLLYRNVVGYRKRWAITQIRLAELRTMPHDPNNQTLWLALYEALYVARRFAYSSEVCNHNLEVVNIITTLVSEEEYRTHVQQYRNAIVKGLESKRPIYNVKQSITDNLLQLVVQKAQNPASTLVLKQA